MDKTENKSFGDTNEPIGGFILAQKDSITIANPLTNEKIIFSHDAFNEDIDDYVTFDEHINNIK